MCFHLTGYIELIFTVRQTLNVDNSWIGCMYLQDMNVSIATNLPVFCQYDYGDKNQ